MSTASVLVVDVGTSSVRATLLDQTGGILGHAAHALTLGSPAPGAAEQDAEEWWLGVVETIRGAIGTNSADAVTVTNQQISTVAVDASGRPLAPAILWMDQRARAILDGLPAGVGERLLDTTGMPLSSSWSLARPLWWRDHAPSVFDAAASFLTVDAFVYERLCGRRVTDPTNACFSAMNIGTDVYDVDLLEAIGLRVGQLPEIAKSGTLVGSLSREIARTTGLAAGTPVMTSGSDQPCAAVGVGVTRPDQVAVTTGTGTFVVRPSPVPVRDGRLFTNRGLGQVRYVLMGLHYVSGAAWNWLLDVLDVTGIGREATAHLILGEVMRGVPDRQAPLLLPYFSGARTPHFDDTARAVWGGMTLSTSRADLAYSVLESNAFGVREIVDAMDEVCGPSTVVRLAGAAAASDRWCQLQANGSGIAAERVSNTEATTLGAAITALVGLGVYDTAEAAVRDCVGVPRTFEVDPLTRDWYAARRAGARDLYKRTRGAFHG